MHLVGFTVRIYHDTRSPEQCQIQLGSIGNLEGSILKYNTKMDEF